MMDVRISDAGISDASRRTRHTSAGGERHNASGSGPSAVGRVCGGVCGSCQLFGRFIEPRFMRHGPESNVNSLVNLYVPCNYTAYFHTHYVYYWPVYTSRRTTPNNAPSKGQSQSFAVRAVFFGGMAGRLPASAAVVNLDHLTHNINVLRGMCASKTQIMGVVKVV